MSSLVSTDQPAFKKSKTRLFMDFWDFVQRLRRDEARSGKVDTGSEELRTAHKGVLYVVG